MSGGRCQRVAVVCALVKDAPILVVVVCGLGAVSEAEVAVAVAVAMARVRRVTVVIVDGLSLIGAELWSAV